VNDQPISWLLSDSRSSFFPEESLFFALKTSRNDGHRYIVDLYKRGIRHFVVSDPAVKAADLPEASILLVPDTLLALQQLAAAHRRRFDCPVWAITGSNGKTIVKEWLWQLLRTDVEVVRSPRSYNSQIGVPLSVWQLDAGTDLGLFEAGISQHGEMKALQKVIQPTMGLLTNIGAAHQENFTSLAGKAAEKVKLFKTCSTIVYCQDHDEAHQALTAAYPADVLVGWSLKNPQAPLNVSKHELDGLRTAITYTWKGQEGNLVMPFADDPSVENALHCLTVLLLRGMSEAVIAERMLKLEPVAMRLEVKEGKRGCVVINDSYNADVNALELALDFQARRSA